MSNSGEQTRSGAPLWPLLFLAIAVLLAWLVVLMLPYLPNGDDYFLKTFADHGPWSQILERLNHKGLQRCIGFAFASQISSAPAAVIGPICVAIHTVSVLLFYEAARRIVGSISLALALAVIFGVFPGGYHAVVWAPGSIGVVNFILFLMTFLILHSHAARPRLRNWAVNLIVFVLIFLTGLIEENLVFATPFIGVLAWAVARGHQQRLTIEVLRRETWVWIPAVAVVLYLLVLIVAKPKVFVTAEDQQIGEIVLSSINPRTVLSVWFYQHRFVLLLEPWLRAEAYRLAFQMWTSSMVGVAAVLAIAAVAIAIRKGGAEARATSAFQTCHLSGIALLVMMFALSGTHALAGGYKGDSRHNYIPIALSLLWLGWLVVRFLPTYRPPRRVAIVAVLVLCIAGVGTNWLVTGLYLFESRRHQALVSFMLVNSISGPVRLKFDPSLYYPCPRLEKTTSHSFRENWIFDYALSYHRLGHSTEGLVCLTNDVQFPLLKISGKGPQFRVTFDDDEALASRRTP